MRLQILVEQFQPQQTHLRYALQNAIIMAIKGNWLAPLSQLAVINVKTPAMNMNMNEYVLYSALHYSHYVHITKRFL